MGPKRAFLRTYHDPVDPDGFAEVKNGWESLVGTGTEQLDPILSLSGLHTRSHRLFWVLFVPIFVFLRTLFDPVYPYGFASVEMGGNH